MQEKQVYQAKLPEIGLSGSVQVPAKGNSRSALICFSIDIFISFGKLLKIFFFLERNFILLQLFQLDDQGISYTCLFRSLVELFNASFNAISNFDLPFF